MARTRKEKTLQEIEAAEIALAAEKERLKAKAAYDAAFELVEAAAKSASDARKAYVEANLGNTPEAAADLADLRDSYCAECLKHHEAATLLADAERAYAPHRKPVVPRKKKEPAQ